MSKHEWRKKEKTLYLPKTTPTLIEIPAFQFITISGAGNPNSKPFSDCITALYSVAYPIKMNLKKRDDKPSGYSDYTVYPLEGLWDVNEKAKNESNWRFNKDDLVFKIMIRQPDFVSESYFKEMLKFAKKKNDNEVLDRVQFETITDGKCVQMMHIGSYDDEPESFDKMEEFSASQGLRRLSKTHREIYISDFRKVPTEKLKTVLRFKVA